MDIKLSPAKAGRSDGARHDQAGYPQATAQIPKGYFGMPGAVSDMVCARLQGHSVVACRCRTADGFLPCPGHALRVLTPTYPPAAYRQQPAVEPAPTRSATATRIFTGYTGSICDNCGGLRMRRAGTCEVCDDCGNAGGCG